MKRKIAALVPRDHILNPQRELSERLPLKDHHPIIEFVWLQWVSSGKYSQKFVGG